MSLAMRINKRRNDAMRTDSVKDGFGLRAGYLGLQSFLGPGWDVVAKASTGAFAIGND